MPVTSVRVDLYQETTKEFLHELAGRDVARVTLKVLNRAKVLCPVDTGTLRSSHQFRFTHSANREVGEVFTKTKYALPVHQGRGAVIIRAKKRKALAFYWHGQLTFRKSVFQPARRGRPWLKDALQEVAAQEGYKVESSAFTDGIGNI